MHNMLNLYPASMGMTTTPQCIPTESKARSSAKNLPTALKLSFMLIRTYRNYAFKVLSKRFILRHISVAQKHNNILGYWFAISNMVKINLVCKPYNMAVCLWHGQSPNIKNKKIKYNPYMAIRANM